MVDTSYSKFAFMPALFLLFLLPDVIWAKRIAPAAVKPVIHEGVRYSAPNDDGRRGYIVASDVRSNKKLWDLTVFTNHIDPKREEDVQWFFITALGIRGNTLVIRSERGTTYQIDLQTKAIMESESAWSAATNVTTHLADIPAEVNGAIHDGSLATEYELCYRLNPFYLRGDFTGDGKLDVAALVKQHSSGKIGIAIIDAATKKATILGAGTAIGNGGDDFEWMDSWKIYPRDQMATQTSVTKFAGDALFLSKTEAASALLYWDGKHYVWFQQGD